MPVPIQPMWTNYLPFNYTIWIRSFRSLEGSAAREARLAPVTSEISRGRPKPPKDLLFGILEPLIRGAQKALLFEYLGG